MWHIGSFLVYLKIIQLFVNVFHNNNNNNNNNNDDDDDDDDDNNNKYTYKCY